MQNSTLNFLKGIACIAVVFIHVSFPGVFGQIIVALSRSAVALFFIISGYYLYRDTPNEINERMSKKIKKIAVITLWAFVFYFLWESFTRLWGGGWQKVIEWYSTDLFTLDSLLRLILFSYDPVVGHLWFLVALLEGYLLFWLIYKIKLDKHSWILAIVLLEIHVIIMTLSTLLGWGVNMTIFRSVWFYGLPFLMLGYSIRLNRDWIDKNIKPSLLIVVSIICIAITIIERLFIGSLQIFQGTILFTLSIFILAVRYPNVLHPKGLIVLGAKYSSHIYIYHWFVMELFIKLREILSLNAIWFDWVEPIGVFLVTWVGVVGLFLIKNLFKKTIFRH